MRTVRLSMLLLFGLPGVLLAIWQEVPVAPQAIRSEQIRARYGAPAHISRQAHAFGGLEQWHYDAPHHLRFDFEYRRGELPALTGQHAVREP